MRKSLFWEDVKEGQIIPPIVKHPTTRQLVRYAGVSGDFNRIHYDKDFAQSVGLPGVILHGALKSAFLAQILTDWVGISGKLKKLGCQYRQMDEPDMPLFCKGFVRTKYVEDEEYLVECEIWLESEQGRKSTLGWAIVALPTKSN
jgi:hydroxyacyl-ACP dehydratase HTD2-like protein with hotdog domain